MEQVQNFYPHWAYFEGPVITNCDHQGQADLEVRYVEDAPKPESLSVVRELPFPLAVLAVSPGVKGQPCVSWEVSYLG